MINVDNNHDCEITINSFSGHSVEQHVAKHIGNYLSTVDDIYSPVTNYSQQNRQQEIDDEQLYFARVLADDIKSALKQLPRNAKKGELSKVILNIQQLLSNTMLEI